MAGFNYMITFDFLDGMSLKLGICWPNALVTQGLAGHSQRNCEEDHSLIVCFKKKNNMMKKEIEEYEKYLSMICFIGKKKILYFCCLFQF